MKRFYTLCRMIGYICGLIGVCLFLASRHFGSATYRTIGGILFMVMFVAFFCSYIIFATRRMTRGRKR